METNRKEATMFPINTDTRAGRMMQAGRVTVTFRSPSGQHITLTAKARTVDADGGKWHGCELAKAKVVFIEVPNDQGWNDKVGKITRSKGFVADRNADPARTWCAGQLLRFLAGQPLANGLEAFEESACGRCGRALTDPVSIERGIGPECYGQMTGSQHEVKATSAAECADCGYAGVNNEVDDDGTTRCSGCRPARRQVERAAVADSLKDAIDSVIGEPECSCIGEDHDAEVGCPVNRSDGRDRQGVAYGHGDWRSRQRVARQEIDRQTGRKAKKAAAPVPAHCMQMTTLPGETWEDIFAASAGAKGIELPNLTVQG